MNELEKQIEAAYDYRGHVTVNLTAGEKVEGFLFNREFANPLAKEQHYVDLVIKDRDERRRIPIASIRSIELTGQDCAAGNSFEDYLKKKQAQPKS